MLVAGDRRALRTSPKSRSRSRSAAESWNNCFAFLISLTCLTSFSCPTDSSRNGLCLLCEFMLRTSPHSTCWPGRSARERELLLAIDASAAWTRLCVLTETLGYCAYSSLNTANCSRGTPAFQPTGELSRCCALGPQPQGYT